MKKSNKTTPQKVVRTIAIVLCVLVAAYSAFYLVSYLVFGNTLPMPFGFGAAVVLSGSMEPELSVNDLIFVVRASDYDIGDVVVYTTGGTPVVHRVIEKDAAGGIVVTKGDANNTADDPVSLSKVAGRVKFSVPKLGVIPRFVRTVPGMILTLVLLFVLTFLSSRRKQNETRQETEQTRLEEEIEQLRLLLGQDPEKDPGQNQKQDPGYDPGQDQNEK